MYEVCSDILAYWALNYQNQWKTLLCLKPGPNRATGPGSVGLVHT